MGINLLYIGAFYVSAFRYNAAQFSHRSETFIHAAG